MSSNRSRGARNAREKSGEREKNKSRSCSREERSLTEEDLRRIVSDSMRQQIPSLILETSKVVTEQMSSDAQDTGKSFTSFSQEMKQLKQRQEEVANLSKAAALKSDGETQLRRSSIMIYRNCFY